MVIESKRVSVFSQIGEPQQILQLPGSGLLWGCCCKTSAGGEQVHAFVTDVRAGYAKVYVLNAVGQPHDGGMSAADLAAKKAAFKKAQEEEKMREWQATKAK